jgi:hypothetical protein
LTTDTSITGFMREFRECARHVWNTYFQPLDEGWHEFINVEHSLFAGLVLSRLGLPDGHPLRDPAGYYPAIGVVPEVPPHGLPIMFAEPGSGAWKEARLSSADFDMRYVDFFDFAHLQDPHDFRYVHARVLGAPDPLYIGKDVLLEMPYVNFVRRATL